MSGNTQEKAESSFGRLYPVLISIMNKAIDEWRELSRSFPTLHSRTRACFIRDQIVAGIREYSATNNSVRIVERGGLFLLRVGDFLARFKKLDYDMKPSNIPTQQALQFEGQQLEFEGFPKLILVNIGYSPDRFFNDIQYRISCVEDKSVLWVLNIQDTAEESIASTTTLNVEISTSQTRRVKPKVHEIRKAK